MQPGLWTNAMRIDAVDNDGQAVQSRELPRANFEITTCLTPEFLIDNPYLRANLSTVRSTLERARRKLRQCSYHTVDRDAFALQLSANCETEERDGSRRRFEMRLINLAGAAQAVIDLRLRPEEAPEESPFMRIRSELSHLGDTCTGKELTPRPLKTDHGLLPPALIGNGMAPDLAGLGSPLTLGQITVAEWGLGNLYFQRALGLADSVTTISVDWWPHTSSLDRAVSLVREQFQNRTFMGRPIETLPSTGSERVSLKVIPMEEDDTIALVGIDRFVQLPGVPGVVYVSLNTRVADGKKELEGALNTHLTGWVRALQDVPLQLFDQTPPLGRWVR